jgi:hypothetical protein
VVDREPQAALERELGADPALLDPRRRVEVQMQVRPEAPEVDLAAELLGERPQGGADGDQERAGYVVDRVRVADELHRAADIGLERAA